MILPSLLTCEANDKYADNVADALTTPVIPLEANVELAIENGEVGTDAEEKVMFSAALDEFVL
jgi:hypothetical protein